MSILRHFRKQRKNSASVAKERLQIIISHERTKRNQPDILNSLKQDLLDVITKYFKVDAEQLKEQVKVDMEKAGDHSVLELNITLPDLETAIEPAPEPAEA
ncbi:MAG: cell division topological specificity factor MinE [Legionellales bacterium]|nr:cell division topological specificity factor MinE [Legionellales bacterium]|tara:strand:- start:11622 stop:11924 length:303 start_codon:yes stop_codon:yes gene_type:complete